MKVLQINTYFSKGSTGRIVEQIYDALLIRGDTPYVIYGCGPVINKKNVYRVGNKLNYYFQKYRTHLFGNHAFYSSLMTLKMISLIKKI